MKIANVKFLPWDGDARRQYINSRETFFAARSAAIEAQELAGQMFWRSQGGREYLIRVSKRGGQKSLGRRSPETQALYTNFYARKSIAKDRLDGLSKKLRLHARLNQALGLNRADQMLIDLLNGIDKVGLGHNLIVIDNNALIAYEICAGVRDGDFQTMRQSGERRKRLTLGVLGTFDRFLFVTALHVVDKSFSIKTAQDLWSATNRDGYEVVLIREKESSAGPPKCEGVHCEDYWQWNGKGLTWLLNAPIVRAVIVGRSGTMAQMTIADPRAFVLYKIWIGAQADLPEEERQNSLSQAQLVLELVENYLPNFDLGEVGIDHPATFLEGTLNG